MDDAQRYVDDVRNRLHANGFAVSEATIGGLPTVVGYKSQFRWRWFASKIHLFVCVAPSPPVTYGLVEHFASSALELANNAKGAARGFNSGVAVIAALAGPCGDPRAKAVAEHKIIKKFAAFAWPVLYDTSSGVFSSHRGRPKMGAIYTKWMRQQIHENLEPLP